MTDTDPRASTPATRAASCAPRPRAEWNARPRIGLIAMLIPATRTEQPLWQKHVEPYRDDNGVGQSGALFGCVLLVWRRQ